MTPSLEIVRRHRVRFTSIFIALALVCLAFASPPAYAEDAEDDAAFQEQVQALVRRLNDDELARRQKAEDDLIALGPAALAHLPKPEARVTAEVRERLERISQRLEQQAAENAAKPTKVTLRGEMTLAEALAELERQSGNRLLDLRGQLGQTATNPTIEPDLENVDYWRAVDAVCDLADVDIYHYIREPQTITIANRDEGARRRADRAIYAGPFRIEAVRIEAVRDLRTAASGNLRLRLQVAWEPRLAPITLEQSPGKMKAAGALEGDAANEEAAFATTLGVDVVPGSTANEFDLPLPLPPREARKLPAMNNTLDVLLPGRVAAFTFDNLKQANNVSRRHGNAVVVLEKTRHERGIFEVRMLLRYDRAEDAFASHRAWYYQNKAYLLDGEGNKIEHLGMELTRQDKSELGVSYKFDVDEAAPDLRFVYETPATVMKLPVEYEVKEIELP